MMCPKCANEKTIVPKTEKIGGVVRRLRFCSRCGFSFTTTERPSFTLFTQKEKEEYEEYIAGELAQVQKDESR